jgi:hypothetical protein
MRRLQTRMTETTALVRSVKVDGGNPGDLAALTRW